MAAQYLYTDKIGAGPDHPDKRWGLFSSELTDDQARARYDLDAGRRQDWFGIIPLTDADRRPRAFLQMSPRANGVELQQLDENGSVASTYIWRAYDPADEHPHAAPQGSVFMSSIAWYGYPEGDRFLRRVQSLGHVVMDFRQDGTAVETRTTKRGFGEPSDVEEREFANVDVSANWFDIPQFGDWEPFFNPTPTG